MNSSKYLSPFASPVLSCILLFVVLNLSIGCDSTSVTPEPILTSSQENITANKPLKPSVIDDRIVFVDSHEFRDFMASIINKDDSYLDSVESSMNFVSLRTDTELLSKKLEQDIDALEIVEDPFFATILNAEGEFQVGNMVYKITKNHVYQMPKTHDDLLTTILSRNTDKTPVTSKTDLNSNIEVFEVERSVTQFVSKSNRSRASCEAEFIDRRRIKGQAWISYWYVFASATTEIESQAKSWFRWWRTSINWVSIDVDYDLQQIITIYQGGDWFSLPIFSTQGTYNKTKYDASEIRKNFDWNVGIFQRANKIVGTISSSYSGNRTDEGTTRTRK